MPSPEHVAKLEEGVEAFNQWRINNPAVKLDFSGAKLSERDLRRANLSGAYLFQANLFRAVLFEANLRSARLDFANLSEADLSKADLSSAYLGEATLLAANLWRANLEGGNLSWADLRGADLRYANLGGANLWDATLRDADLSQANLSYANIRDADFTGADLGCVDLKFASLVRTNLEGANLTGCSVFGTSVWGVKMKDAVQPDLVITPHYESVIQVDNLEVAQFVYLLLNNERIRDVIDTVAKKAVLILGRFTDERKPVLDRIREALRQSGYLPILFDFDKPTNRDTQETIVTLAGLVRFIVADITDAKSIPQELVSIVQSMPSVPVQPLLQIGEEPWGMYDHIKR